MDELIAKIAKKYLHIDTLEIRKSDRLDFYDCPVWGIKEALETAFKAGVEVGVGMSMKPLNCTKD